MEFLTEDVVKELGLTPEQVSSITSKGTEYISDQKKEWDKKANDNAEGILTGAANYLQEKTGVKIERQNGEKFGDYVSRISTAALESKTNEIEKLKTEYNQKIKDFKGDEATKQELETAKKNLDDAKKQLADYDTLKDKAEKFDTATSELSAFKIKAAFGDVKPAFSKDANQYEVSAKWNDFQKRTQEKFNLELVDGEYLAIDKENQYKTIKLSELVVSDEDLKTITSERQVGGTGAKVDKTKIEGIDGDIPVTAKTDVTERTKIVKEQIAKEGILPTDPRYSARFAELNKKIKESN
ncbi:hypothetical protein [Chryseobacterium sp.]|jgi:DNA polymerase III psi subunit|uniref:hypothetical protein n=1 Tax=Chryseobacterium sp. TaxID=1871047 RepID=UPI00284A3348|nr:hypothetical protein [Chryseobacterium sp.]MDR3026054.1 hypothetical protein [Chryseobacterium sp.]